MSRDLKSFSELSDNEVEIGFFGMDGDYFKLAPWSQS